MSEYQYYEFQAVDQPLTQREMTELRAMSTRATITPTRFQNVYHYGDFKGDPLDVIERYFDAFTYVANWGTHWFMLRLPVRLLDMHNVQRYSIDGSLNVHDKGDVVILEFLSQDEEGAGWIDDGEAASWMPALLPLRADLVNGDLRALYLGWLAGAEYGMLDDEELEPPVPPGLDRLSASLKALAAFTRISDDLLGVAATRSGVLPNEPSKADIKRWIENLPSPEKNELLSQLATGSETQVRAEIRQRVRSAITPQVDAIAGTRTVGELLAAANKLTDTRYREEAERKAVEQVRRERELAEVRTTYLDSLVGREDELWTQIDAIVDSKRPKEYDQAVQLLTDLNDSSVIADNTAEFTARLGSLRDRCSRRPSFIERLDRAGLRT